jgi:hypothetical protein
MYFSGSCNGTSGEKYWCTSPKTFQGVHNTIHTGRWSGMTIDTAGARWWLRASNSTVGGAVEAHLWILVASGGSDISVDAVPGTCPLHYFPLPHMWEGHPLLQEWRINWAEMPLSLHDVRLSKDWLAQMAAGWRMVYWWIPQLPRAQSHCVSCVTSSYKLRVPWKTIWPMKDAFLSESMTADGGWSSFVLRMCTYRRRCNQRLTWKTRTDCTAQDIVQQYNQIRIVMAENCNRNRWVPENGDRNCQVPKIETVIAKYLTMKTAPAEW